MKTLHISASAVLFAFSAAAFTQSTVSCGQMLDAPLRHNASLDITSLSSGVEIVGKDQETIHISCTADDPSNIKDTRLQFSGTPTQAKLSMTGPHLEHNNLKIRIEVPRKLNLSFRMPAGEVKVDEIAGDKDIEIHAGRIVISSAHNWDYKDVSASVDIGAVKARVFGVDKGGFFRSFRKENAGGEYRLHAHVTTGEVDLFGQSTTRAANSVE